MCGHLAPRSYQGRRRPGFRAPATRCWTNSAQRALYDCAAHRRVDLRAETVAVEHPVAARAEVCQLRGWNNARRVAKGIKPSPPSGGQHPLPINAEFGQAVCRACAVASRFTIAGIASNGDRCSHREKLRARHRILCWITLPAGVTGGANPALGDWPRHGDARPSRARAAETRRAVHGALLSASAGFHDWCCGCWQRRSSNEKSHRHGRIRSPRHLRRSAARFSIRSETDRHQSGKNERQVPARVHVHQSRAATSRHGAEVAN